MNTRKMYTGADRKLNNFEKQYIILKQSYRMFYLSLYCHPVVIYVYSTLYATSSKVK